jgi:hypothetical protein
MSSSIHAISRFATFRLKFTFVVSTLNLAFVQSKHEICSCIHKLFKRTECQGVVVTTPASYAGGRVFDLRLGDRLTEMFHGFTKSLKENSGVIP